MDKEGAQDEGFKFHKTVERLRRMLQHDLQAAHKKGHPREGQDRDTRKDSRRDYVHTVEKIVDDSTVEKDEGYLYCIGESRKIRWQRKLYARSSNKFHKQEWQLASNQETLELQNKGNIEENEKTSKRVHCPYNNMDNVEGTILCVCGAKQPNLLQEQEKLAGTSLQEGFAHIQALTKLEIRPPNLRGNVDGQSRAQQQFGKAQHHFQEAVSKSVKIGNTKERRKCSSMTERWDLYR